MLYFMEKSPVVLSMPGIPGGALRNCTVIGATILRVEKIRQQQQTTQTKITVIDGDHKCKAYTAWQTQEVSAYVSAEDQGLTLFRLLTCPNLEMLTSTILRQGSQSLASMISTPSVLKTYLITLVRQAKEVYPQAPTFAMPQSTPELLRIKPWFYGSIPWDDSEYSYAASLSGVTFWTMVGLDQHTWFSRDLDAKHDINSSWHHMDIMTVDLKKFIRGSGPANNSEHLQGDFHPVRFHQSSLV
jgi:hypothetical protein